ncbi:MAG: hypothetical protein ABMA00_07220 [Gemmatimonas sp.]
MKTSPIHLTHARRGRLLVECLVALMLLNTSALVVVSLTRSAARSTQSAQLTSVAWGLATEGIEAAVASPCATGASNGTDVHPRLLATWTEQPQFGWRERNVDVALTLSPLTAVTPMHLSLRAARSCP